MFAIVNSIFDEKTQTSYYNHDAGYRPGRPAIAGIEPNSSRLRGYLLATIASLAQIRDQYGAEAHHQIDILLTDPVVSKQLTEKTSVSKILHSDDGELWKQFLALKALFDVHFVASPAESEHLTAIWKLSCSPIIPAELNPMASAPPQPKVAYVPGPNETVGFIRARDLML